MATIEDATASPPPCHESGLRRIAQAGATITTAKGIYYEWLRDLETLYAMRKVFNPPLPPGFTL